MILKQTQHIWEWNFTGSIHPLSHKWRYSCVIFLCFTLLNYSTLSDCRLAITLKLASLVLPPIRQTVMLLGLEKKTKQSIQVSTKQTSSQNQTIVSFQADQVSGGVPSDQWKWRSQFCGYAVAKMPREYPTMSSGVEQRRVQIVSCFWLCIHI